jgi:TPR repeat protein
MKNHSFELINRVFELIQDEDYESAYKLIKPEAEKGDADFQHMLGVFYFDGKFVEVNYDLAVYWLTKSAYEGDSTRENFFI